MTCRTMLLFDRSLAERATQLGLPLDQLRWQGLRTQLRERRVVGVAFGVPFLGEPAVRDVVDDLAHLGCDIEVGVVVRARELPVLADRRMMVHLCCVSVKA